MKTLRLGKPRSDVYVVALYDTAGDIIAARTGVPYEMEMRLQDWRRMIARYEAVEIGEELDAGEALQAAVASETVMSVSTYIRDELCTDAISLARQLHKGETAEYWVNLDDFCDLDAVVTEMAGANDQYPADFIGDADNIEAVIGLLVKDGDLMSEEQIREAFEESVLEGVIAEYGWDDDPAVSEAFSDFVDGLDDVALYTIQKGKGYGIEDIPAHMKGWRQYHAP